jgi:hypothetical protein
VVSYPWLKGNGHPGAKRRPPLPPNKRHRDRKNDYQRQPKHKKEDVG